MNFPSDIMAKLLDGPADQDTIDGIELVEAEVTKVIGVIDEKLDTIKPDAFDSLGAIQPTSFGDTERSSLLSVHHRRAHQVTYETLVGVRADLVAFRKGCADARLFLQRADDNAADEAALTRKAVDRLTQGSSTNHAETANTQARQNGSGIDPTDDSTGTGTDPGTDTSADTSSDPAGGTP
ncbi:MAG TPA: hypothetical protein VM575_03255 [Nocardioides sp.]|jgi:hypothetical protein|nr:hypothetical protein [Nocardioides sp.]